MGQALTIGQVSRVTGVAAKTIRYYEGVGALPPADRTAAGYRQYTERSVERVRFVRRARALGLSVPSLRALASALNGDVRDGVRPRLRDLVRVQLRTVKARKLELETLQRDLEHVLHRLEQATPLREPGRCRCLGS